jgi:hypothetical protein
MRQPQQPRWAKGKRMTMFCQVTPAYTLVCYIGFPPETLPHLTSNTFATLRKWLWNVLPKWSWKHRRKNFPTCSLV